MGEETMGVKRAPDCGMLDQLLRQAVERYEAMTPDEKEAHDKAQRESWVRGMKTTGDPAFD